MLVLLPTNNNKLLMQWKGPYKVIERIGMNDYQSACEREGENRVSRQSILCDIGCRGMKYVESGKRER